MDAQKQKKITERYEKVLAKIKQEKEEKREIDFEIRKILRKGDKKWSY